MSLLPERHCCLSGWEVAFPAHFATLVLGKTDRSGKVELVNAGHNPVLLVEGAQIEMIAAANLPLGMFCSTDFTSLKRSVRVESTLFPYSDGITESIDRAGNEFGTGHLTEALLESRNAVPSEMVETIHRTMIRYTAGAQPDDDRTMLALRFSPKGH